MLLFHERSNLDGFQRHLLEMLDHLDQRMINMALDLTNANTQSIRIEAAVDGLTALVTKLLAANSDPAAQAALDVIVKSLGDKAASAEAVLAANAPPPPAPAPVG